MREDEEKQRDYLTLKKTPLKYLLHDEIINFFK